MFSYWPLRRFAAPGPLLLAVLVAAAGCDPRAVPPVEAGTSADALPSPDAKPVRLDTRPVLYCKGSKLSDLQVCAKASDCGEVPLKCCSCANGGTSVTVHKSCVGEYMTRFRKCNTRSYTCATVYLCGAPPVCKGGLCRMP